MGKKVLLKRGAGIMARVNFEGGAYFYFRSWSDI